MAKAAAIFVIALVLVAAVLLRPVPELARIPARASAVHTVALPGVDRGSESVRRRFRVGSEYGDGPTQVAGTNAFTELRTSTPVAEEPLAAHPLPATADAAPIVVSATPDPQRTGHLTRAFETAAQQTSGAFRTAGRALRSVF